MLDVDFIITTMNRYELLSKLLESIKRFYPKANVTVADQSKDKILTSPYIKLEHDIGLSRARNELIRRTSRPYILLLEDDFLFTKETKIEKMLELMQFADIVGGRVIKNGKDLHFEHNFERKDDTIYQVEAGELKEINGIKYKECDCVLNFALFRREVFDIRMWNENLKVREHQEFFWHLRDLVKTVYTPDVSIVDNKGRQSPEYRRYKDRDEYWKIALESMNAKRLIYLNGQAVEIENNKIVRYSV